MPLPWPTPARPSVATAEPPSEVQRRADLRDRRLGRRHQVGTKGRQARQLAASYEDIAVQLVREGSMRSPRETRVFWHETVRADPALKAIRRRLRFEDLIVTNK